MIKVCAVTPYPMSQKLLERYIGGVLKGMASVKACNREEFEPGQCHVAVVYDHSPTFRLFSEKYRNLKLIGIRFTIQASGVRTLAQLTPGSRVGVVADHHQCANMLLREIMDSGIFEPRFITGAFSDMESMKTDTFAVAEEMDATLWTKYSGPKDTVKVLPRSLMPSTVGEIIGAVARTKSELGYTHTLE